jgi:hypothetical protein
MDDRNDVDDEVVCLVTVASLASLCHEAPSNLSPREARLALYFYSVLSVLELKDLIW